MDTNAGAFMNGIFKHIVFAELRAAYRTRYELLNPIIFFGLIVTLFPMTLNPIPSLLRSLAPGVIWVAALLSLLLSLDRLFRVDYHEGTLEQLLISPHPLPCLVFAKTTAHWCVTALPLLIVAPGLGCLLQMSAHAIAILMLGLLIGTPALSLIGGIGAALTVALRQGSLVLVLLILPLYIPILIFGTGAVVAVNNGLPPDSALAFLGALSVLAMVGSPFAMAAALRIGHY